MPWYRLQARCCNDAKEVYVISSIFLQAEVPFRRSKSFRFSDDRADFQPVAKQVEYERIMFINRM